MNQQATQQPRPPDEPKKAPDDAPPQRPAQDDINLQNTQFTPHDQDVLDRISEQLSNRRY